MSTFVIGLDLGQTRDFSAVAVLEHRRHPPPVEYHIVHLERFALKTSYPTIVSEIAQLLATPELAAGAQLVVDGTGVGRGIVDMFHAAGLPPSGTITIHGGDSVSRVGSEWRVPKRDLVAAAVAPLQEGRLKFAENMPLVPTLIQEMLNFKVQISDAGHDSYAAWRENQHDDLILAVMLGCWWAQHLEQTGLSPQEAAIFNRLFQWW